MNNDFKNGFEKIAGVTSLVNKAVKLTLPKAKKVSLNTIKYVKPKSHKSLGGVFGPGSFK